MEATALSLAKLTLDTLLPVAKNALADEAILLLGVHEEVSFITNELEMMQAFLRAAAGADDQASNEVAKIWVKQVRDLAYDVEDCLQEYLALDFGSAPMGCDLPPCARLLRAGRLRAQHQIAVRIKQVKGRVEEISKRNLRYRIVVQPTGHAAVHDIAIEHQVFDAEKFAAGIATEESELVGRAQHRAELVDRLVSLPSSEPLQVFALWGMGGVGKTVLARDVLRRSPKLRQAFQLRPWVTVPHPFVMAEFISSLASELEMMETESRSLVPLHTRVVRHLRDRKYAMVVDDVLTIAEWDKIKQALPDSRTGSCIVVTTRDESVAMHCSTSSRHVRKLDCLSDMESFQLLCKKVQLQDQAPMMPLVDPILRRCCGLPLAVAAVGKLLATMKTPAEWKKLHDHLGSELKGNPRLEEITNVLTSSYEGLPYHLKSCFLYLSIFPKYRELRQTRVSWRWMAEGLVTESSSGMEPEDVGENYFNQLISRSMIQPATTWVNLNDRINTAQVHDMMREIILAKASEENQLFVLNARLPSRLPREKIRHLVITSDCRWPAGSDVLDGISNMRHVRSLTINGECPPRLIIPSKMKMLRVLDLEDCINATDEHLSGIGELRQLKYLGLKKAAITKLPESVGRLKFLQSLDIRGTKVTTIPQGITKLERLRHLMAGNGMLHDDDNTISSLPSWRAMSSTNNARKLLASTTTFWPQVGSTAVTIGQHRHSGVRLPDGFGRLKSMHNLGTVDVGKDGQRMLKEISKLAGLGSLEITELTNRDGPEFRHMIHELVSLRDLEVRSRAGRSGLFHCLDMIVESPPLLLVTLRLCGHLGKLPMWIGHLQYITKIKLLATELEQDAIEMLGALPNLTGLHLWRMSYIGQELRLGTGKFPKLKLIDINCLEDLVSLVIEGASTPRLEWLWLKQCCRLSDDENGVVGVPLLHRLRELQIRFCGDKPTLVDLLQKQLGDHQNRLLFQM